MPPGKYTRKEAGLQAFLDTTGVKLPERATLEELKEYVRSLSEAVRLQYHRLYLDYMSVGRPHYLERYNNRNNKLK